MHLSSHGCPYSLYATHTAVDSITEDHEKYDQILLVKTGKHIPGRFLWVRTYLLWSPAIVDMYRAGADGFSCGSGEPCASTITGDHSK